MYNLYQLIVALLLVLEYNYAEKIRMNLTDVKL